MDGVPTEFKTLNGNGASDCTVKNALNSAKRQAPDAIVDARACGISRETAQLGLIRFLGANPNSMQNIRIVGNGWEINWSGGTG